MNIQLLKNLGPGFDRKTCSSGLAWNNSPVLCGPSLALYNVYSAFIREELEPLMFEKVRHVTLSFMSRFDTAFSSSIWAQDLYPPMEARCLGYIYAKFIKL